MGDGDVNGVDERSASDSDTTGTSCRPDSRQLSGIHCIEGHTRGAGGHTTSTVGSGEDSPVPSKEVQDGSSTATGSTQDPGSIPWIRCSQIRSTHEVRSVRYVVI